MISAAIKDSARGVLFHSDRHRRLLDRYRQCGK
jgi:hypothetical protein